MAQIAFWNKHSSKTVHLEKVKDNMLQTKFLAIPENEQLARMLVASYLTPFDPTMEELSDVKTAVSEAVTNAVIHGYPNQKMTNYVHMTCKNQNRNITIMIQDDGVGIENVKQAMEPLYTTKPEQERSGMGFAFMQAFMDTVTVTSEYNKGVTVVMTKVIGEEMEEPKLYE